MLSDVDGLAGLERCFPKIDASLDMLLNTKPYQNKSECLSLIVLTRALYLTWGQPQSLEVLDAVSEAPREEGEVVDVDAFVGGVEGGDS